MRKKILGIMGFLLLAIVSLSFVDEAEAPDPDASAYEPANENTKFKRTRNMFYSKKNKELRAKWRAEREAKKAADIERRAQEAQDKGEGQFTVKF